MSRVVKAEELAARRELRQELGLNEDPFAGVKIKADKLDKAIADFEAKVSKL